MHACPQARARARTHTHTHTHLLFLVIVTPSPHVRPTSHIIPLCQDKIDDQPLRKDVHNLTAQMAKNMPVIMSGKPCDEWKV